MVKITPREMRAIKNILDMYMKDEKTNYEENNYPKGHIYKELLMISVLYNNYALEHILESTVNKEQQNECCVDHSWKCVWAETVEDYCCEHCPHM